MPLSTRFIALRWLRCMAVLWVLLVVGYAPHARADVPMCGLRAQTVAAPPIGTKASNAQLLAINPCKTPWLVMVLRGQTPERGPDVQLISDPPLRAMPQGFALPLVGQQVLPRGWADSSHSSVEFSLRLERPPKRA